MIAQAPSVTQFSIAPEVMLLALNKVIAAKVLTWDSNDGCKLWGTGLGYMPSEIEKVEFQHDTFKFNLTGGRAIPISAEQFVTYWNAIQRLEAEMVETEEESEVIPPTVDTTPDGTPIDYIEMAVNGVEETRLAWMEQTWEGILIPHIFFQQGDDRTAWINHYLKSKAVEPTRPTVEEVAEIQVVRVMELERNLQPQPKTNPHTQWFEDLKVIASRKGYRISLYDAHLRQVIIYGRNVKLYVQFKYNGKWGVSPNFHSQPRLFDGVEEAIAYIETADTPQVLIEPWVFDKPSMPA